MFFIWVALFPNVPYSICQKCTLIQKTKRNKKCSYSRLPSGIIDLPPLSSFCPQSRDFLPRGCKVIAASTVSRPLTGQEGERAKGNSNILFSGSFVVYQRRKGIFRTWEYLPTSHACPITLLTERESRKPIVF